MSAGVSIAMMSIAGREEITGDTCRSLMETGGIAQLGVTPVLHYHATADRTPPETHGWRLERHERGVRKFTPKAISARFRGKGTSPWLDFAAVLCSYEEGRDALFFEDDLIACTNAVVKMAEVEVPEDVGVLSFFDYRNEWPHPGIWRNPTDRELYGAQALKIPARVLPRLQELAHRGTAFKCWDVWLSHAMNQLGLRVAHYAPSLVQHVGMFSLYAPGGDRPMADNWPGEAFNAIGPCPDPIPRGERPSTKLVMCEMHGEIHPNGRTCGIPA